MGRFWIVFFIIILVLESPIWGWWPKGHDILTRASIKVLPKKDFPEFFRLDKGLISHCAIDPDITKNKSTAYLEPGRHPTHYFDLELLKGYPLPKSKYEFFSLCDQLAVKPEQIGILPYVVAEWTEQLALAFTEFRKWPHNPFIQSKCLIYAGFVAHYAQEVCQPLNLTIHWNGRVDSDGTNSSTKIHERIDSLIQYLNLNTDNLIREQQVNPFDDLMVGIWKQIEAEHSKVDLIYQLEDRLTAVTIKGRDPSPEVVDFALERAREAVRFTAALYLTAWKLSGRFRIPRWIDREELDLPNF